MLTLLIECKVLFKQTIATNRDLAPSNRSQLFGNLLPAPKLEVLLKNPKSKFSSRLRFLLAVKAARARRLHLLSFIASRDGRRFRSILARRH